MVGGNGEWAPVSSSRSFMCECTEHGNWHNNARRFLLATTDWTLSSATKWGITIYIILVQVGIVLGRNIKK